MPVLPCFLGQPEFLAARREVEVCIGIQQIGRDSLAQAVQRLANVPLIDQQIGEIVALKSITQVNVV